MVEICFRVCSVRARRYGGVLEQPSPCRAQLPAAGNFTATKLRVGLRADPAFWAGFYSPSPKLCAARGVLLAGPT